MEEKSWKQGRVEARFEGGQGQEGAVAQYIDGWMDWLNGDNVYYVKLQFSVNMGFVTGVSARHFSYISKIQIQNYLGTGSR
jgi:hypothetical protein